MSNLRATKLKIDPNWTKDPRSQSAEGGTRRGDMTFRPTLLIGMTTCVRPRAEAARMHTSRENTM